MVIRLKKSKPLIYIIAFITAVIYLAWRGMFTLPWGGIVICSGFWNSFMDQ